MSYKRAIHLLRETGTEWIDDNAASWAACLAFYTMLSIGPLVFTVVTVAGLVCGRATAQAAVLQPIEKMMGASAAQGVAMMMTEAGRPSTGLLSTAIGAVVLIFGATGVFAAMQDAMNAMWNVRPKSGGGIKAFLRRRVLSVGMVFGLGFLLLASLLLNALTTALLHRLENGAGLLAFAAEVSASLFLTATLLAGIFKFLPDAETAWRNAWMGAAFTAALLETGKFLISFYLGKSNAEGIYGSAGSLAVVLLWVYYAAQILFLGAEFTQVYSNASNKRMRPRAGAEAVRIVPVSEGNAGLSAPSGH